VARAALDLGFMISFSGILTFRNAEELREVARMVPLDRCLIETDSPYLAPCRTAARPTARPGWVSLMLERGAQIDAPSPNGSTALMMAARYGADESALLLLARGASTTVRNQRDMNAADFARSVGRDALAAKLAPQVR
jgi:hypothetical protein